MRPFSLRLLDLERFDEVLQSLVTTEIGTKSFVEGYISGEQVQIIKKLVGALIRIVAIPLERDVPNLEGFKLS